MSTDKPPPKSRARPSAQILLLILASAALLAGLWTGLLRLGWQIPPLSAQLLMQHGPLMVSGFFGILLSLERGVAISQVHQGRKIYYLLSLLAGLGVIAFFLPFPAAIPRAFMTFAALGLTFIFVIIYRMQPSTEHAVLGLGASLWLAGNGLWLAGLPIYRVVPFWAGFLILTIAGERLELTRVLILKQAIRRLFLIVTGLFLAGLIITLFRFDLGLRIAGLSLIALGAWLLRYDIARRTIRKRGLTRYIAACLLPGYLWLALGGLLWLI